MMQPTDLLRGPDVAKEGRKARGRQRSAEVKALHLVAANRAEKSQLIAVLHTLGDHLHAERVTQVDDGLGDGRVFVRVGQVVHEGTIDLDHIYGKPPQVVERRV